MSMQELQAEIRALPTRARRDLMKWMVDVLAEDRAVPTSVQEEAPRRRSLLELRGLGKEIWQGIDVQAYLDEQRNDWDKDQT